MSRRLLVIFITFAVLSAALFARLGIWQLSRLRERQAFNAVVMSRRDSAEVPIARAPHAAAEARFRRVLVEGRWDHAHELVLGGRSRDGSPGVHLLTPVRLPGTDTAVLVNRGWAYAPDGETVDQRRWRARGDSAVVHGFVVALPGALPRARSAGRLPVVHWVEPDAFARWAGYPVFPFQVVMQGDTAGVPRDSAPARLAPTPLDEGPHRGYAFQWFTFALIALVGVPVFLLTRRREAEKARRVPPAPRL